MKENNEKFKRTWNKEKLKYREFEINRNKRKRIYISNCKRIWNCLETLLFVIYPSCLRPFFRSIPLKTLLDLSARTEKVKRDQESRRTWTHIVIIWGTLSAGSPGWWWRRTTTAEKVWQTRCSWRLNLTRCVFTAIWKLIIFQYRGSPSQGRYRAKTIILTLQYDWQNCPFLGDGEWQDWTAVERGQVFAPRQSIRDKATATW